MPSQCVVPPNQVVGMQCCYTDNSGNNWNDGVVTSLGTNNRVSGTYNGGASSFTLAMHKPCLDEDETDYNTWGCAGENCPPGEGGGIRPR